MNYFALTMLATVGFGDYLPLSNIEKIITVFSMLSGVAFFSYVMENTARLAEDYKARIGDDFAKEE
jgi:hypothetical protein